ncbi:MAG: sulfatase-like hydrolase/transferase [Thermoplasmata archaeon]|nr:sulfatase-like hydrolase/transferase [Thermoplasmata archaeon]
MPVRYAVLMTADSLRADHLSCYGYEKGTTPNIDAFGARGTVMENAFCQGSNTLYSFPAILGGFYPLAIDRWLSGHVGSPIISGHLPMVAESFKAGGFATGGFHSNPHISRYFGYARGFDTFWDSISTYARWDDKFYGTAIKRRGNGGRGKGTLSRRLRKAIETRPRLFRMAIGLRDRVRPLPLPYAPADRIHSKALEFLDSADGPAYLWLHYMDTHFPYNATPADLEEFSGRRMSRARIDHLNRLMLHRWIRPNDVRDVVDLYDASIWALDRRVGRFLDELDGRGILSDGITAFTADHGDCFYDHGVIRHPATNFHDVQIHVPLVCRGFGDVDPSALVGLIDLGPTMLARCGLDVPADLMGRPLPHDREEVYTEVRFRDSMRLCVRTRRWKYIWEPGSGEEELYDLREDPSEERDVAAERRDVAGVMRDALDLHRRTVEERALAMRIRKAGLAPEVAGAQRDGRP